MLIKQNEKDKNIDYALENLKPKVFWKDKPIMLRQAKKWNYTKLKKLKELFKTEVMKTKMNNYNSVCTKKFIDKNI